MQSMKHTSSFDKLCLAKYISPVLFCVYIDDILLLLSKAGVDCHIGSNFVGALAYTDEILLITPTATALLKLLIM